MLFTLPRMLFLYTLKAELFIPSGLGLNVTSSERPSLITVLE